MHGTTKCPSRASPGGGTYSFTTPISNDSHDISVLCDVEVSDYANLKFIIDTGAMSSIIKYSQIKRGTKVFRDETKFFGLIKNQFVCAIGRVETRISMGNSIALNHIFYIIRDEVNLPLVDGIIGSDFLKMYIARIDYLHSEMKLQFKINLSYYRTNDAESNTEIASKECTPEIETVCIQTNPPKKKQVKFNDKLKFYKFMNILTSDLHINRDPSSSNSSKNCNENVMNNQHTVKSIIKMKNSKKVCNVNFYRDLPLEYLEKFPKTVLKSKTNDLDIQKNIQNFHLTNFCWGEGSSCELSKKANEEDEPYASMLTVYEDGLREITSRKLRTEYLKENINLEHCSKVELEAMINSFERYNLAFKIPGDKFKHTTVSIHRINLKPGTNPIHQRQFRTPEYHREELQRQVRELESNEIISKCNSPWNSPIFLVPKKSNDKGEKQFRLVIDYKELNKVIEPTSYPMPLIDEIIDQMHGCKYFTTLDLHGAYHQIPLDDESRQYTAFSTSWEKYCFNSVPFGLVSSPYAWLRTISSVMKGIIGNGSFVYMDDIIVFSVTLEEHMKILSEIFERFIKCNLKLKIDKSKFLREKVNYLGFIISSDGLMTDPKKVEGIVKYTRPKTVKEVQSFVGMCNYYRRYIPDYAGLAKPLYNLCKKEAIFDWTNECEKSFEAFKKLLSEPPILIYPNFEGPPFILRTDCSQISAAGVLSQGEIPDDLPINYFSKTLNPAQTRYSTIEKELLAIILSVEYFHYYLIGREFCIVTDHRPLTFLFNSKNMSARIHRWKYILMSYQFKIIYKSGKSNVVADALSRVAIDASDSDEESQHLDLDLFTMKNSVLVAETRSHTAKNRVQSPAVEPTNVDIPRVRRTFIREFRDMAIQMKEFDHIFYLITKPNDELHKKLQHKLKKQIEMNIQNDEILLHSIDENRSIYILSSNIRNDRELDRTKAVVNEILKYCNLMGLENIAINIRLHDPFSHFNFKMILYDFFKVTNTSISLFLNQIIEVTDVEMIEKIMWMYHDSLFGGHNGAERMKQNVRKFYSWHGLSDDITKYVKDCPICEKAKITTHTKSPMEITTIASEPFQKIYIDMVGPINPKGRNGDSYIMTCNCSLTKFVIAVPIKDITAITTAHNLVHHVFLKYGLPEIIVTDNGTNFISETLKEVNRLFKIKKVTTTSYRPNSNQIERFHRSLGNYLKAFVQKEHNRWSDYLDFAIFSYNNSYNIATGFSPFELVFGRICKLPTEITSKRVPTYNYENYANELRERLRLSHELAKEHLLKAKETNKKFYDRKQDKAVLPLKKNDLVLILKPVKKRKFEEPYEGPFRVIKELGPVTALILRRGKAVKIHKDRLKLVQANYGPNIPALID